MSSSFIYRSLSLSLSFPFQSSSNGFCRANFREREKWSREVEASSVMITGIIEPWVLITGSNVMPAVTLFSLLLGNALHCSWEDHELQRFFVFPTNGESRSRFLGDADKKKSRKSPLIPKWYLISLSLSLSFWLSLSFSFRINKTPPCFFFAAVQIVILDPSIIRILKKKKRWRK